MNGRLATRVGAESCGREVRRGLARFGMMAQFGGSGSPVSHSYASR